MVSVSTKIFHVSALLKSMDLTGCGLHIMKRHRHVRIWYLNAFYSNRQSGKQINLARIKINRR
jgi:hypothetical protein